MNEGPLPPPRHVEVIQEPGVVPRRRRATIGTPL